MQLFWVFLLFFLSLLYWNLEVFQVSCFSFFILFLTLFHMLLNIVVGCQILSVSRWCRHLYNPQSLLRAVITSCAGSCCVVRNECVNWRVMKHLLNQLISESILASYLSQKMSLCTWSLTWTHTLSGTHLTPNDKPSAAKNARVFDVSHQIQYSQCIFFTTSLT